MNVRVWRALVLAQFREQPARLLVTMLAIALGVALGTAVYLVNATALNEFGLATKRLVGEADLIVRGPRDGFAESWFAELARDPSVAAASPVLEIEAAIPGSIPAITAITAANTAVTAVEGAAQGTTTSTAAAA